MKNCQYAVGGGGDIDLNHACSGGKRGLDRWKRVLDVVVHVMIHPRGRAGLIVEPIGVVCLVNSSVGQKL